MLNKSSGLPSVFGRFICLDKKRIIKVILEMANYRIKNVMEYKDK